MISFFFGIKDKRTDFHPPEVQDLICRANISGVSTALDVHTTNMAKIASSSGSPRIEFVFYHKGCVGGKTQTTKNWNSSKGSRSSLGDQVIYQLLFSLAFLNRAFSISSFSSFSCNSSQQALCH